MDKLLDDGELDFAELLGNGNGKHFSFILDYLNERGAPITKAGASIKKRKSTASNSPSEPLEKARVEVESSVEGSASCKDYDTDFLFLVQSVHVVNYARRTVYRKLHGKVAIVAK